MNILQSEEWEAYQQALGRETFRDSGAGWSYLAILEHGRFNRRLYCPYGPSFNSETAFEQAVDSLKLLASSQKATFIRIEPTSADITPLLQETGWKKVDYQSLNPEHSQMIDLTPDESIIVSQMDQPNRNILRNYHKKGFHVKNSQNPDDMSIFIDLIHQVAKRTGMRPHPDSYYLRQAQTLMPLGTLSLWLAMLNKKPIASAIMLDSHGARYYTHAAADLSPDVRKLNAPTALLAEAILDAKRRGLTSFDLYGIAPDDAPENHRWKGFTKFKKSFGGKTITHAGSWDLPINRPAYYFYRAYQRLTR